MSSEPQESWQDVAREAFWMFAFAAATIYIFVCVCTLLTVLRDMVTQ